MNALRWTTFGGLACAAWAFEHYGSAKQWPTVVWALAAAGWCLAAYFRGLEADTARQCADLWRQAYEKQTAEAETGD